LFKRKKNSRVILVVVQERIALAQTTMIDSGLVGWLNGWGLEAHSSRDHTLAGPLWEGYLESRRCSRDTYPESYITEYTLVYED